ARPGKKESGNRLLFFGREGGRLTARGTKFSHEGGAPCLALAQNSTGYLCARVLSDIMSWEALAMSEKRRLKAHNARSGKLGELKPKHNDRNFDTEKAPHIDKRRAAFNRYWVCDDLGRLTPHTSGETFDELERDFYETHFAAGVEA